MRTFWTALISLLAAACAALPALPPPNILPVEAVVDKFECEFKVAIETAISNGHTYLYNWAGTFQLTLKVEEQGGVAIVPATAVTFPFSTIGNMFTLNFLAGETKTARRVAFLKFSYNLKDVGHFTCPTHLSGDHPLIAGDVGIKDWFERTLGALGPDDLAKEPSSIGHTTEFEIVASGGLGPSVVISRVTGTGALTAQRTDTDTLDIALAAIPPEPTPTEVVIVGSKLPRKALPQAERVQPVVPPAPRQSLSSRVSPAARERLDRVLQSLELRTLLPRR